MNAIKKLANDTKNGQNTHFFSANGGVLKAVLAKYSMLIY